MSEKDTFQSSRIKSAAANAEQAVKDARRYEFLVNVHNYLVEHGRIDHVSIKFEAHAVEFHDQAKNEIEGQIHDWWRGRGMSRAEGAPPTLKTIMLDRIKNELKEIEGRLL